MGLGAFSLLGLDPIKRRASSLCTLLGLTQRPLPSCLLSARGSGWIAFQFVLYGGKPCLHRGFDLHQLRVGLERLSARVRPYLGPVHRNLVERDQAFFDQRRHAFRQKPIEHISMVYTEVSQTVIVHRPPASQPTIGKIAFGKPRKLTRRALTLNRRI